MSTTKFDALYKVIMEGKFQKYNANDAGELHGQFSYDMKATGNGVEFFGKIDGKPVVNQETGEPIKWEINATYRPCKDYVTKKRIPANSITFWLPNCFGLRDGIHVAMDTYEAAYNTANPIPELQAQLQAIGLDAGYQMNVGR